MQEIGYYWISFSKSVVTSSFSSLRLLVILPILEGKYVYKFCCSFSFLFRSDNVRTILLWEGKEKNQNHPSCGVETVRDTGYVYSLKGEKNRSGSGRRRWLVSLPSFVYQSETSQGFLCHFSPIRKSS